jgi:Family of unknown function (DUF6153)
MLICRLAVIGLLVGLVAMHGLAAGGAVNAAVHAEQTIADTDVSEPCDAGTCHQDPPPSHDVCVAVLGGAAMPGLVGGGAPSVLSTAPSHTDEVARSGPAAAPTRCPRPRDLTALCVLRI